MTAKEKSFLTSVWDFLCSLKLTIIILILLAVTSIIGTVVQQNLSPQEYLQIYTEKTYKLLDSLQFFDMYHSWWFLSLLGLFSLNLICCSIKRFPRVWNTVMHPQLKGDESLFRTLSNADEVVVGGTMDEAAGRLRSFVQKHFAGAVETREDDRIYLFAQKGPYARFGVYVTHLSILIIFIGAIIGNIWGYKGYMNVVEGGSADTVRLFGTNEAVKLPFAIRCDRFEVSFYEGGGRPKEYVSDLVVLDNGQDVLSKTIEVNDPLSYQGITFYQSSYGPAGDPSFKVRVRTRSTGEEQEILARQGEHVALPGGRSFAITASTPSYDRFGPAIQMHVNSADGQHGNPFVVLQNFPDFDAQRGDEFIFSLLQINQSYYTGLQVGKDPGVWVVWLGCFLMIFGSLAAFFISHRRIWVTLQPVDGKIGVRIGGSAHRNQPAFELFFDDFKAKLKDELKG
ncbi:MAG: cytochrome c biogenesis protein ResB [Desulfuromonadales bacterium]|nr:cytochrome c biogenesis protein ResB [Desulfuromonadales bacterium]MDW7756359.1 cytochrome c biogenesis protein ResB [Desulfuromonadales bacterium]